MLGDEGQTPTYRLLYNILILRKIISNLKFEFFLKSTSILKLKIEKSLLGVLDIIFLS